MAAKNIPEIYLSSGDPKKMPIIGLGTATSQRPAAPEVVIKAVVDAIELGYRHFDTASVYGTESALGEAISQALNLGLIKSRDELFITSKLWCPDAHPDHVIPALKRTLKNLKLEYLDLYLVHWLVSMRPGSNEYPPRPENLLPMDIKSVWTDMEKCQTLGLTKFIGVSNLSVKKLGHLLAFANIPPVINQVEMNPVWQQRELHAFCKANGILTVAYSPLGGAGTSWGSNRVMESEVLKKIAQARGKSIAQVALRWVYEQGVAVVVKSFNKERLKQNLAFFDWELSTQEAENIANNIPQFRALTGEHFISADGPIKSFEELWDEDV